MFSDLTHLIDLVGVAVFAASGALVASRKEMDIIGFILLSTFTAVGGGTLRDLILDRPVFWITDQSYLVACLAIAVAGYFAAHLFQKRYVVLLWMDAVGLAAYGVLGAHIALGLGTDMLAAMALGVMTATFGGLIRDVVSHEQPLILRHEIYATAALLAACVYVGARAFDAAPLAAAAAGFAAGFALRAGAIVRGWALPRYRPRPGRTY